MSLLAGPRLARLHRRLGASDPVVHRSLRGALGMGSGFLRRSYTGVLGSRPGRWTAGPRGHPVFHGMPKV